MTSTYNFYCTSVYGSNGQDRVTLANFEKLATEAELRVTGANLGNLGRTLCGQATIVHSSLMAPQVVGPALPVSIPQELNTKVLEIDKEPVKVAEEIGAEAVTSIDPNDNLYVGPSDDTAVPLQHIIRESLGLDIPTASLPGNEAFCVAADKVVVGDVGDFEAGDDTKNIWACSDNGTPFRDGLLLSDK
ncbi:hypothetical protein DFH07DRAFT_778183 [Mycena maculata]|uniref:Uncharacterized protein n=1 Tax=Mycena maculata TaxID=230809 RepID=A0AAD7IG34_9AGAR|nr:hypothetical protein DFH07DRAFT_778183 [Mycena maculata]